MKVLDLFSGIGGFSLGLERAGCETIAFCECDPFCRRVLAKHWPEVPIHHDIRELDGKQYRGAADLVCGGFPCQDLSVAGRQAGIDGERSSLWGELARIIGEVRPRYAIVENVPALLSGDRGRWFGRVLGDLAALGFDAQWHCIPASAVGAPHQRDRVWLVAYPDREEQSALALHAALARELVAYAGGERRQQKPRGAYGNEGADEGWPAQDNHIPAGDGEGVGDVAYAGCKHGQRGASEQEPANGKAGERHQTADNAERRGEVVGNPASPGLEGRYRPETAREAFALAGGAGEQQLGRDAQWWAVEPDVGRVAHGVPARTHRLRALGNAVVPAVVEVIGRAIQEAGQ